MITRGDPFMLLIFTSMTSWTWGRVLNLDTCRPRWINMRGILQLRRREEVTTWCSSRDVISATHWYHFQQLLLVYSFRSGRNHSLHYNLNLKCDQARPWHNVTIRVKSTIRPPSPVRSHQLSNTALTYSDFNHTPYFEMQAQHVLCGPTVLFWRRRKERSFSSLLQVLDNLSSIDACLLGGLELITVESSSRWWENIAEVFHPGEAKE